MSWHAVKLVSCTSEGPLAEAAQEKEKLKVEHLQRMRKAPDSKRRETDIPERT